MAENYRKKTISLVLIIIIKSQLCRYIKYNIINKDIINHK